MNGFTREEIKNSVEYEWRKSSVKWILVIWAIIETVILLSSLLISLGNIESVRFSLDIFLIMTAIYSVTLLPFAAFYGYKMMYLLKHYESFNSYEVMLDNVSTSYAYRGAVYYTVSINEAGNTRRVATNPYFSSGMLAKFPLEEYNNKKVIGLYDDREDKFYIIKKIC